MTETDFDLPSFLAGLRERCTRAGALLGLNRDQIRYRIEKFALTVAP